MMKLSEIRKAYEDLSGKLSDINRQLCFAGFAIIWIFNKSKEDIAVPEELYLPAFLLCCSIFCDIFQYILSSLSWYFYYSIKRKKEKNDDENIVDEPESLNIAPWMLFIFKIIFLILAYMKIGVFLFNLIESNN